MEAGKIELPVAEIESNVAGTEVSVRLKGQRPDDECRIRFLTDKDGLKSVLEARKRGATVCVQFALGGPVAGKGKTPPVGPCLVNGQLVVHDVQE